MSQPSDGVPPPAVRREHTNSASLYSFRMFPVAGRWEQLKSASLVLFENAGDPGQRRRIIPPNAAAAASASFPNMSSGSMDSERSLTDMITGGCTPAALSDNIPRINETPACDEAPARMKRNQKRTKNFSVQEDEMLVKAWLNVSLDRVHGADQPHSTYWKRIYDYFHSNKDFASDRSQNSLMSRWSGIQHDVNIFADCVSKVEGKNQSGLSIDDKQAKALTMFKEEDKMHRNFPYIHCWKKLKDQSKWMNRNNPSGTQKPPSKKQKTTAESSSAQLVASIDVDNGQPAIPTLEKPAGKEKDKLRQRSSIKALDYLLAKKKDTDVEKELKIEERELKKERFQKALALQEERIKLEKEKFDFERDLEEERIMNVDTSTMSTKQQQFYEHLQAKILARQLEN